MQQEKDEFEGWEDWQERDEGAEDNYQAGYRSGYDAGWADGKNAAYAEIAAEKTQKGKK